MEGFYAKRCGQAAYSGQEMKVRNMSGDDYAALRLINDDEVLAVIPSPTSVMIYC